MTWTDQDERRLAAWPVAFAGKDDIKALFPDPCDWARFLSLNPPAAEKLRNPLPAGLAAEERRDWCRALLFACAPEFQVEFRRYDLFEGYLDGIAAGRLRARTGPLLPRATDAR